MSYCLEHPDGKVLVEGNNTRKKISVTLSNERMYIPVASCETSYSDDLIKRILEIKGPAYLCDEINRDELADYVERSLRFSVLGYVNASEFEGKSILDFGCGSAASTMVLGRMLPNCTITGIDLEPRLLEVAVMRSKHHGLNNRIKFAVSPSGDSLPQDIGEFDFIFLNAVFEHLLPDERSLILPLLWKNLKRDGIMFINQTPNRWFPIEFHTTSGLVFLNYLPDHISLLYAQRFSRRKLGNDDWQTLLRAGIRGGSVREITGLLSMDAFEPMVLVPSKLGLKDRTDIWYAISGKDRYLFLKKSFRLLSKGIERFSGIAFLPSLAVAIRKTRKP
jgi:2-polyprenyl-3-methyl-5-hydroxy-6-metoxy-1,4-benzoquinol methylase